MHPAVTNRGGTGATVESRHLDEDTGPRVWPVDFIEKSIVRVPPIVRTPMRIPAKLTTANQNTNKIEFELESEHFLDLTDGKLDFHLTLNGGSGATWKRACNRIHNMIDRIVVRNGNGSVIYDQRRDNWINSLWYALTRKPSIDAQYGEYEGVGSPAAREAWASARKRYRPNIECPLFTKYPWPSKYTGPIKIELYLAAPSTWIETNGTNPTFDMDGIELHFDELVFDDSYYSEIESRGVLFRPYVGVEVLEESVHSAGGDYNISLQKSDMRALAVITKEDNWNLPYVLDKFETFPYKSPDGAIPKSARIRIGTKYYPQEDIRLGGGSATETSAEALRLFYQFAEQFRELENPSARLDDFPVDIANFQTDKFVFVVPMRSTGNEGRLDVIGTSSTRNLGGQPITINYKWNTAPSTPLKHYFWCFYSVVTVIDVKRGSIVTFD